MTGPGTFHIGDAAGIRFANSEDAERITALINEAFRIAEGFFIDGERTSLEDIQRLLTTGAFIIAESDNVIAGCVYVEPRGEHAYLGLLAVDPARQQSGLGSRLMLAAEAYGREQGARVMDICIVNLRKELPAFYQHRGYVESGTTPFPPDALTKQPCYFIDMSKQLFTDE